MNLFAKLAAGLLLILVFAFLFAWAGFARAEREGRALLDDWVYSAPAQMIDLSPAAYANLPPPVRRYFDYAFNGQNEITVAHVNWRERGEFLLPVGRFTTRGGQTSHANAPVYAWIGTFYKGLVPMLESRDAFNLNEHNMRAKLFGHFKVMHTDYDDPADIRALHSYMTLRYYGQAPLMPWALLPNDNVAWDAIDDNSAWLVLSAPEFKGRYRVHFEPDGRISRMETDGVMLEGNGLWEREVGLKLNYAEMNGFMVPTEMDYTWMLEDGSLSRHYRFIVSDVVYRPQEIR